MKYFPVRSPMEKLENLLEFSDKKVILISYIFHLSTDSQLGQF